MAWWNNIFGSQKPKSFDIHSRERAKEKVLAEIPGLQYRNIMTLSFNGEKNLGDVGPAVDYVHDLPMLRTRSWQAQYESDIAQIAVKRLVHWTISTGLKPQSEPFSYILEKKGIKFDKIEFQTDVETRFNLFRKTICDHSGQLNLNQLSDEAEYNATVSGDVLVLLRLMEEGMTIQLVDGSQVMSPFYGSEYYPQALKNGNRIIDGVEVDERGRHVAYYVRTYAVSGDMHDLFQYKFDRIEAIGKNSGQRMAYLYYGSKMRINNTRGIPLLSACINKIAKLERYSEATLGQAEEAAKVSYQVVHDRDASGKLPWSKSVTDGFDLDRSGKEQPMTNDGVQLKKEIQVTTQKTAFNNPPGAEIKVLENKNPLYFKDFYEKNTDTLFAVLELPPNVAMSLYTNSFSASRAAIKDWEHTLTVKREHHAVGFLKPIFDFWFDTEVLQNNISAPGYLLARAKSDKIILEAYRNIRYVGARVPHIDPEKELKAARLMLGTACGAMPLADGENVTEMVGGGDITQNIEQVGRELKLMKSHEIKPEATNPQNGSSDKEVDDDDEKD